MVVEQITASQERRFWDKVDKTSSPHGCWLWRGGKTTNGYGLLALTFGKGQVNIVASRMSWLLKHGSLPKGMEVCHNCPGGDNRLCVNPKHLWLGTKLQNLADTRSKGRGFVPQSGPGESNPHAKLTYDKVKQIRRLRARGVSGKALALQFGIVREHVYRICNHLWGGK